MKFTDEKKSAYLCALLLVVVFILALGLRVWGIDFGLGLDYHNDESGKVKDIISFVSGNTLTKEFSFRHPVFMRRYAAAVVTAAQGITSSKFDYSQIQLVSRISVAILGALTVIPLYFLGKLLISRNAGLLSALILAVVPTHVVHSHYLKEDITLTFWITLFLLAAMHIIHSGKMKYYIFAGLMGGLALSTKYTAVVLVSLPLLKAHLLNIQRTENRKWYSTGFALRSIIDSRLWIAFLGMTLSYIVINIEVFMNLQQFLAGLNYEFLHAARGHQNISISPLPLFFSFHLRFSLWPGMTPPLLIMSFAGILAALWMNRKNTDGLQKIFYLLFTLLVFYLTVELALLKPLNYERYALPCIPILSLFAAWIFVFFTSVIKQRFLKTAGIVAASLIVISAGIASAGYDRAMVPDTRDSAAAWIEKWLDESLPPHQSVALFEKKNYLPYRILLSKVRHRPYVAYDVAMLFETYPEYIVVSDFAFDRYFLYDKYASNYVKDYEIFLRFYKKLFATHTPYIEFKPDLPQIGFNNPTIRVYKMDYSKLESVRPAPEVRLRIIPRMRSAEPLPERQ
jgi:hypothetical protein